MVLLDATMLSLGLLLLLMISVPIVGLLLLFGLIKLAADARFRAVDRRSQRRLRRTTTPVSTETELDRMREFARQGPHIWYDPDDDTDRRRHHA